MPPHALKNWLLIDKQTLMSDALSQAIKQLKPATHIDTANNSQQALQLCRQACYQIVLLDVDLIEVKGVQLIKEIRQLNNNCTIFIYSPSSCDAHLQISYQKGANGFLSKEQSVQELLTHIDRQQKEQEFIMPEGFQIESFTKTAKKISERQLSILLLLRSGISIQEIAEHMDLSHNTIKTHLRLLYKKLEARNRIDCLNKAEVLGVL